MESFRLNWEWEKENWLNAERTSKDAIDSNPHWMAFKCYRCSHYHIQSSSIAINRSPTKIIMKTSDDHIFFRSFDASHTEFRLSIGIRNGPIVCALWHCTRVAGVTNRLIQLLWFLSVVVVFVVAVVVISYMNELCASIYACDRGHNALVLAAHWRWRFG